MVRVEVKSYNETVKAQRELLAQRVIDLFGFHLSQTRLLIFLDDCDPPNLKRKYGPANRGFYAPIHGMLPSDSATLDELPDYVIACVFPDEGVSQPPVPRGVDDFVYLYGTTCANEIGLTMTMAHELQHALQHANEPTLWAVNTLVTNLSRTTLEALEFQWRDIPIELDARIVSKRVAITLFGERAVDRYLVEKIAEPVNDTDARDCTVVRGLSVLASVNLLLETRKMCSRLRPYWAELEGILQEAKLTRESIYQGIRLEDYL
ncbi:MAG TPA: hypothetical protein VMV61_14115 [Patescibacteria group bacterium]|nr:hypothetical protein [Patescibacteria group bacterium]